MSWLRGTIATAAILLAGPGSAAAQVASPSLLPNAYVYPNPAVLQWAAPSAVGAGYGEAESTDNPAGDHTFGAGNAGARLVWETIALGGEWAQFETLSGPQDESGTEATAQLAVLALDWLSAGVLYNETAFSREEETGTEIELDARRTAVGVSLRMAEVFFLGYAQGTEELDLVLEVPSVGKATPSDDREVRAYGAGVRWGQDVVVRAEYFVIEHDAFEIEPDPVIFPGGEEVFETTTDVAALELGWGPVIAGVALSTTEDKSDEEDTEAVRYAVAWAPKEGFGFVAEYETEETTDASDTVIDKTDGWFASVVYQF